MASQLSRTAPPARHATVQPIAATPELPSAVPLMALSTGFWAFKTLAAAHELDLFSRLAGGAGTTVAELAEALGLHQRPAEMLLTGCAALGLLEKTGGRYRNTPLSETYLVRGKPYYFGGFVQMLDKRLYPGWGRLAEALRTNRPTTWDPAVRSSAFDGEDPIMLALFWEAMHSVSTMTARKLGEAMDFGHFRRLLDIGGGSGAYDIELCKQYGALRATVFDLPHVADRDGRAKLHAGRIFGVARGSRIPGHRDGLVRGTRRERRRDRPQAVRRKAQCNRRPAVQPCRQ